MSDVNTVDSPVQVPTAAPADVSSAVPAAKKVSPAQELRDIQNLLVMGIFPGNLAPAVCQAHVLLEKMAVQVEKNEEAK